jgi:hypothetical protein
MPLPDNFSEWEHLQITIRRVHNDSVRSFYRNTPDNNLNTKRGSAKHACLMKDNDTTAMTILRMWLFWIVCRKLRDVTEPYYGIPIAGFDAEVVYKPQITLFFLEDFRDVEAGYRAVEGQLSIRLIKENSTTLSQADLKRYANKINLAFGQGNGLIWDKGKHLYSYVDKVNGHRFKILTQTQTDAESLVRKLLDIVGDRYNSELLRLNEAVNEAAAFPTNPPKQTILGKVYKQPRKRPKAKVKFQYASIKIHGLPKPIILVDKTGYWSEALINVY